MLRTATFPATSATGAALTAGTIDAAYLDPNAAYDAFVGTKGSSTVTVVAGAASGGAMLVTRAGIITPAELRNRTIAVPRAGSAQDVALRTWLASEGLFADQPGGVTVTAVDAPATLAALRSGAIDGAWMPEPWASRLVSAGDGRILVDERALWPGGAFSSGVLAVRTVFIRAHPQIVSRLVAGHVTAEELLNTNGATAQRDLALELRAMTGQDVSDAIAAAWPRMRFINDPLVATLQEAADHAKPPGVVKPPDLRGFVDVGALNSILHHAHRATVGQ